MYLVQGIHPAAAGDANRARLLERLRHNSSEYYKQHGHRVRRRQLLHNLNTGKTRLPTIRSIQKYGLRYLPAEHRWE